MPLLALNQARRRGPGALRSHLPAHGGTRMHVDPGRCGLDNLFVADNQCSPTSPAILSRPDRARLAPRLFVGGTVKKPKEKKPA